MTHIKRFEAFATDTAPAKPGDQLHFDFGPEFEPRRRVKRSKPVLVAAPTLSLDEIRAQFQALTHKDIKLKWKSGSFHMMHFKVAFKDKPLNKVYKELMTEEYDDSPYTNIDVEKHNLNRLHIDAIPQKLRRLGLGKKMYQAVLHRLGMISTGGNASDDVVFVWDSLIKSGKYAYFHDEEGYKKALVTPKYVVDYRPTIEAWMKAHNRRMIEE